jgi:methionyl aminopeptidase
MYTKIKTSAEIERMRTSGRLLATVMATLKAAVQPGMSTKELSDLAARELRGTGGKPAFLGYYGFPEVLCTSVNEEVVHGIPSADRLLQNGDILSMDFGVNYEGMITDSASSVIVGKTANSKVVDLVDVTRKSLEAGIGALRGGCHVGDIAQAVQEVLERGRYGIVRELVGHGVGHELHEDPNIPNYGKSGTGPQLEAGMTVAIEPMATLGDYRVFIDTDGWTVKTTDGSLAAHFEHTVLVTEDGAEILTVL